MRTGRVAALLIAALAAVAGACSDDPTSPGSGPPTIQGRMDAAARGDTILLEPGIYSDYHAYTDPLFGVERKVGVVFKPGVVLRGATGNPEDVVLDMQGEAMGIYFFEIGLTAGIADLTIRNATWAVGGYDASPWITNCVFEDNGTLDEKVSARGTGLYFDKSHSVIRDCIFRRNQAASGAGASFANWSYVRLERCQFIDNVATGSGGGVSVSQETSAILIDCIIRGNTAGTDGGGLRAEADIEVRGGIIEGNTAGRRGGGCYVTASREYAVFSRVRIAGNTAPEGAEGAVTRWKPGTIVLSCCDTDPAEWYSYLENEITWLNDRCDP